LAYLYQYVAGKLKLIHNWVLGGVVWGIVVSVVMNALIAVRGALEPQTFSLVLFELATNVIFYGLPVAWYLSRTSHTIARSNERERSRQTATLIR